MTHSWRPAPGMSHSLRFSAGSPESGSGSPGGHSAVVGVFLVGGLRVGVLVVERRLGVLAADVRVLFHALGGHRVDFGSAHDFLRSGETGAYPATGARNGRAGHGRPARLPSYARSRSLASHSGAGSRQSGRLSIGSNAGASPPVSPRISSALSHQRPSCRPVRSTNRRPPAAATASSDA